jgi:nucleoside-diphosphate-sugar epimerase
LNILVTGGCGYIGSILVAKLLDAGHDVTVVDTQWFGNYLEPNENLEVIKMDVQDIDAVPMEGVNVVINLANIANDPCGDLSPKLSWEVNVLTAMKIVEKAIKCGVDHFIHSSSGSVYGVKDEEKVTEELSLLPISNYNKTKMISERVLMSYRDNIAIHIIRPATVCGYSPRMRLDVSVNMLTMQACVAKKIKVFGGNQTRPNIHVQDLASVFMHFLGQGAESAGVYNAGFENMSIIDMALKISKKIPSEITITESKDPRSYRLDSGRLIASGFSPKYNVDYAIDEIIDSYRTGRLFDDDKHYNIRTMKELKL